VTSSVAATVADFLRGLRRRLLVDVEQDHARALAREAGGDGSPDAGRGTGDDGDVVFQKRHGVSLCFF
jgi:hypothetical protein